MTRDVEALIARLRKRIAAAAIQWQGLTISKPRPARHADILKAAFPFTGVVDSDYQGFLTDTGEFVPRDLALTIAEDAGQVVPGKTVHQHELFSEDVW